MNIDSAFSTLAVELPPTPPPPAPEPELAVPAEPTGTAPSPGADPVDQPPFELPPFPPGLEIPDIPGLGGAGKPQSEAAYTEADLYGPNGPEPQDIGQDSIGDCYFVATLAALANSPEGDARIEDAIVYNEDTQTFTVTLYEEGPLGMPIPVQVEVTQADIQDNIDRGGGSTVDNNGGEGPIWPAVMEAAYAKRAGETANIFQKAGAEAAGISELDLGYQIIEGGKARNALFVLTGTRGDDISAGFVSLFGPETTMNMVNEALADGRSVTLSTDPENGGAPQDGLADNHVYQVERMYVDEDTGEVMVELRNPWGHNVVSGEGREDSALITVALSEITEDGGFEYFNIGPES